ncbi:hypothetical protein [Vibrio phage BUCT194]|uniref:Uncharacterized protein n=1 Tax=Vibrio phage BUCT194 TaxID=2859072 RepID=A0AAE9BP77_9CAUD|nr:hypothetical protein PP741_gp045 [Vibrio phage BUCT194]UAW01180.1 hypothetical protein [Vibrio phage BUCT194]
MSYKYRITVLGGNVSYLCNSYSYYEDVIKVTDPVVDVAECFIAKYQPKAVLIPSKSALIEILK